MQPMLALFSIRCGQAGAMDYLEYFLTLRENLKKVPYLVVTTSGPHKDLSKVRPEDLCGAVLLYEYTVVGLPTRIFSTGDFSGLRTVIAPAVYRSTFASTVCSYLTERGAQVVLVTFSAALPPEPADCIASTANPKRLLWTSRSREAGASLALKHTVDATLAQMGSHTRRNLRYYRRKADADLACGFVDDVRATLTRAELAELSCSSTHPIGKAVLDRRYHALKTLQGGFCVGVRSHSGQWISLMGGRRHHGITEIDWQINRAGLDKYSIGTVIRAYLIEHEIAIGMKRLFFEGGTPHTIRYSFLSETAIDIVAAHPSWRLSFLRVAVKLLRLRKNYLLQFLVDPAVRWELHCPAAPPSSNPLARVKS